MKSEKACICLFIIIFLMAPSISMAGSVMIGAKVWYAFWDGSPDDMSGIVDNAIDEGILYALSSVTPATSQTSSSEETGTGFLTGPMLAYQTDDRMWSFSLAVMYFSRFNYETESSGTFTFTIPAPPFNLNGVTNLDYEIELKRREIDVALSRSITSWMKIFAGYKYQRSEFNMDVTGSIYEPTYITESIDTDVEITTYSHVPTVGLGFALPLSGSIFLGFQAGVGYLIAEFESKVKDNISSTSSKDTYTYKNTLGFTTEATISFLSWERVLFQLGYRYQGMRLERSETGNSESSSIWDSFHGVTFSALYLFSL